MSSTDAVGVMGRVVPLNTDVVLPAADLLLASKDMIVVVASSSIVVVELTNASMGIRVTNVISVDTAASALIVESITVDTVYVAVVVLSPCVVLQQDSGIWIADDTSETLKEMYHAVSM